MILDIMRSYPNTDILYLFVKFDWIGTDLDSTKGSDPSGSGSASLSDRKVIIML